MCCLYITIYADEQDHEVENENNREGRVHIHARDRHCDVCKSGSLGISAGRLLDSGPRVELAMPALLAD